MIIKEVFDHFSLSFKSPEMLADEVSLEIIKRCFKALVALLILVSVLRGLIVIIDSGDLTKNAGIDTTLLATFVSLNVAFSVFLFYLGTLTAKIFKREAPEFLDVAAPFAIFTVIWAYIGVIISIPLRFFEVPPTLNMIIVQVLSLAYVIYYLYRVKNIKLWVGFLGIVSTVILFPIIALCLFLYEPIKHKFVQLAASNFGEEYFTEFFTDVTDLNLMINGLTVVFENNIKTKFGHPAVFQQHAYFENGDVYRLDVSRGNRGVYAFGKYKIVSDVDGDLLLCFKYYEKSVTYEDYITNQRKPFIVPKAFLESEFEEEDSHCLYPISLAGELKFLAPRNDSENLDMKFVLKVPNDVNSQKGVFTKAED